MAFEGLTQRLQGVFDRLGRRGRISEKDVREAMREVQLALLEADVNYRVVKDFVKKVTERAVGASVLQSLTPAQQVIKIVNEEMVELLGAHNAKLGVSPKLPTIIMLCGLQGAGKTTFAAKLALHLKKQGKKPLLAACDVYRPAAIEQLKVVGGQAGVPVYEEGQGKPLVIAEHALAECRRMLYDTLILDTAGRLHIDDALMEELEGLKKKLQPFEILLAVDAMTGQDAVNSAKAFDERLGMTGVVLTKLDGDTRGGAALSVRAVTGKPIKFASTGEKLDAMEPFHPDRMASRILGMGDVMTLIERAQVAYDEKQAAELERKLKKTGFTLEDFLQQMAQMKKMGGIQEILGMLPGLPKGQMPEVDEKQMARTEAIVLSMTRQEREHPEIMGASRKKRVAAGSGTTVQEVNRLLRQFEQAQQMFKQFGRRAGKRRGLPF
nr:signal recognition particle protein [bacterium]